MPMRSHRDENVTHGFFRTCLNLPLAWVIHTLAVLPVQAGDWIIEPEVALQGTYTDNLFLTNSNKEDDFAVSISPGVSITGQGRRLVGSLNYRLENLVYASNSDFNTTNNQLAANGTVELFRQRIFVDGGVAFGQQNLVLFGNQPRDNLNPTDAQDDILTFSVSPFWVQRWGSFAASEVRVVYNEIDDFGDVLGDSEEAIFLGQIESGTQFNTWLWNVSGEASRTEFEDGEEVEFREITGQLRYVVNRRITVFANLGYQDDDFSTVDQEDTSGALFDVGVAWTPNIRTLVELSIGDRYYGSVVTLNAKYRSRRVELFAEYTKEPELARERQLDLANFARAGSVQDLLVDPFTGQPVAASATPPNIGAEVFVRELFTVGATYKGKRDTGDIRFYIDNRDAQGQAAAQDGKGAIGVYTRQLSRTNTFIASVEWEQNNQPGSLDEDFLILYLGLNKRLGRHIEALAYVQRADLFSDQSLDEYTENRIAAGLRITF